MICPGQGAQFVGMGKKWFDQSPAAREVMQIADEILADDLGAKLSTLCFDGPAERLNMTDVCQPAIYAVSVACYRGLLAEDWAGTGDDAVEIVGSAGLSLGEYTALHLADVFSFEDGLKLVAQRGRFMQEAAEASESSMVALIGGDEEQANAVCDAARGDGVLVCANFNAPGQIVISGSKDACERSLEAAVEVGVRATPIVVAGAFHSPLMASAGDRMMQSLEAVTMRNPKFPVISNVTAEPHSDTSVQQIRELLVRQITSPVRWSQSCGHFGDRIQGALHEVAPGKVLKGLMRRINRKLKVVNHDAPND